MRQENVQNQKILEKVHDTNQRKVSWLTYPFSELHLFIFSSRVIKE
jgi:hypothetical protein